MKKQCIKTFKQIYKDKETQQEAAQGSFVAALSL